MLRALGVAAAAVGLMGAGPADWRAPDPANTLVIDTTKGRVVIELRPDFAPKGVERIKLLAREGVYDGLQFHRVIEGFVAQTGNPNNKDGGVSKHPDLPPEFTFRIPPEAATVVVERSDAREGFVGATPFGAVGAAEQASRSEPRLRAWGAYCPGVVGMGRQADPGSANSELFIMRASSRRLDQQYTVVGRVISGFEAVKTVAAGEPPATPDLMLKVRVASDLPEGERPRVEVQNEKGPAFQAALTELKKSKGAAFSVCDVEVGSRLR
ncbi:MAG: peptidylprolyl isomerase [Pseudomonadota bacterium]